MKSLPVWGIRLRKSSVRPVAWPAGAGTNSIGFIDAPGDAEETLRSLLESVRDLDNHVTISIGATRINPEDDMDAILMRVDDGMYRSKAEGRDRITYV